MVAPLYPQHIEGQTEYSGSGLFCWVLTMAKIDKDRLVALRNEILMSKKLIEEEIQPIVRESVERYLGEFLPIFGVDWDIVLNEVYPIIQNNLASTFFRAPRSFLKPRNPTFIIKRRDPITGQMEEIQADSTLSAKTQENILNYIITQIGYKKEVRKTLLDALLFPFGIMWHGYKGDFGMTECPEGGEIYGIFGRMFQAE